ncbi:MAG: polyphosphate polymerase domain-containing protein, partial [Oscillospiraceae bacterium]|nr:polyphosphate polymerase domain-containing protein [Oscillospiraceae bacterium]
YMALDEYGRSTIRNIYLDPDTFLLVRRSIEKPLYKEKLRVRSYHRSGPEDLVFVEIKKKYDSVVYKRRVALPDETVEACLESGESLPIHSQIAQEIDYFRPLYPTLHPAMFLSYEREAFYERDGGDFRVTFDENILYRESGLSLQEEPSGSPLLQKGQTLMEIKTGAGIPLWMTHCLTENHIFRTSFSKYGAAYAQVQAAKKQEAIAYA